MNIKIIDIGLDFSDVPSGRYEEDGPFNGTKFRSEILAPALRAYDSVSIILDSTEGFGSSFLEEVFGGLIRLEGFDRDTIKKKLSVVAKSPRSVRYKKMISQYIDKAEKFRGEGDG